MSKTAAPKTAKSKKSAEPAEPTAAELSAAREVEAEMFDRNVGAIKIARALARDFGSGENDDSLNAAMNLFDRVDANETIARGLLGDAKRVINGRKGEADDVFEIAQILIDDEDGANRLSRISKELPALFTTRNLIDTYDRCLGVEDDDDDNNE